MLFNLLCLICFLVTPGQVKSKARLNHSGGCGLLRFANFRFWQTSCSGEQRVTLTTRSISTASVRRRIAAYSGFAQLSAGQLLLANSSRYKYGRAALSCFSGHPTHHVPGQLQDGARMRSTRAAHPASHSACSWASRSGRTSHVQVAPSSSSSTPNSAWRLEWKAPGGPGKCDQTAASLRATAAVLSCSLAPLFVI